MEYNQLKMNKTAEEKAELYQKLEEFLDQHSNNKKEKFDADVFRALYKQFLEEDPHIDWNSWKHISQDVQCHYEDLKEFDELRKDILSRVAIIKLNGGLGTTMGCKGPKSFIEVKNGFSFLDIALKQHKIFNERHGSSVPLYLMNSFYTDEVMAKFEAENMVQFSQSRCSRIYADTLLPMSDASAEDDDQWYPPGHGNIFQALNFTGVLDKLLAEGRDIIFVSNIDNTGATMDLKIAQFFADHNAEYAMECTAKTENDIKGGTLIDINGQLMHLEMPQVPPENLDEFCSTRTFKIFNTNNIWVNLNAVKERLNSIKSEIIVNKKKVGGKDVIQLETSIGGCIRNFPRAYCIHVSRERFLPVKTTDHLLALASNLYKLSDEMTLVKQIPGPAPVVKLGPFFKNVADFHERFEEYPEMTEMKSLIIENGDFVFKKNVVLKGDVRLNNEAPFSVKLTDTEIEGETTFRFAQTYD